MKILLVDDDIEITQLISRRLKQDNYVVEVATDGEYAVDLIQASTYGLVLLDLMLPKLNGLKVCQTLRNQDNHTPVLMLTGQDNTRDKVAGLDAGADDYLVKPFELDELTARVRALLRRNSEVSSTIISYGPLRFDPSAQTVTFQEQPIALRPKGLAILELLLRYPTQVFDSDHILDRLWDLADCPSKATVKAHIRSLRKQLDAVGATNVIETMYAKGYRLNPAFLDEVEPVSLEPVSLEPVNDDCIMSLTEEWHPDISSQAIVDETWQQVQRISWQRLSRLKMLVNSYGQPVSCSDAQTNGCWQEDCKMAVSLAHQLKGSLGSFGFQTASLHAKYIEELLSVSCPENATEVALLQEQVGILQHLLQQHMTDCPDDCPDISIAELGLPSLTAARILVAARDQDWAQALQQYGQDSPFQIEICSPLTINEYLLEHTPAVILLELSDAERNMDLSLLDALVSNYGDQVPILTVIEAQQPDEQLVAIHHGASAIALKTWSITTLLTIIAEYVHSDATAQP